MATNEAPETSTAKASTAPAPDDSRKPDSPTDVTKPSWKYIARKTLREFTKDQCPDLAAGLTYYAVLSLFPALLALVSLLGIFGDAEKTTTALLDIAKGIAPGSTLDTISGPVQRTDLLPGRGLHAGHRPRHRPLVRLRLRQRVRPCYEPDLRNR